jgi:hypothetical protein
MPINKDILIAIAGATPTSTGAVKLCEIRAKLVGTSLQSSSTLQIDRQLQAARRAGLAVYEGRRAYGADKPRKHWGWKLTPVGKQTLALGAARRAPKTADR